MSPTIWYTPWSQTISIVSRFNCCRDAWKFVSSLQTVTYFVIGDGMTGIIPLSSGNICRRDHGMNATARGSLAWSRTWVRQSTANQWDQNIADCWTASSALDRMSTWMSSTSLKLAGKVGFTTKYNLTTKFFFWGIRIFWIFLTLTFTLECALPPN